MTPIVSIARTTGLTLKPAEQRGRRQARAERGAGGEGDAACGRHGVPMDYRIEREITSRWISFVPS